MDRRVINRRYYDRIRAMVNLAKARACLDCGRFYPSYVMQLDHRNPKEKLFAVGDMVSKRGEEAHI